MKSLSNISEKVQHSLRDQHHFDRFIPSKLLTLLSHHTVPEDHELTILFSDIRDFTSLTEQLSPRESFTMINSYLKVMNQSIDCHNGVIDKYMGDAIMALFPTSADDAVNASLEMINALKAHNKNRLKALKKPLRIGIGLNSGISTVGTIGGNNRVECTALGDSVNLAQRMETITKEYGVSLLISEHTFNSLSEKNKSEIRFIDRLLLKGKQKPQSIYEVFSSDDDQIKALKLKSKEIFEDAVAHFHYKKIDKAHQLFSTCLALNPDDTPAQRYIQRCNAYLTLGEFTGTCETALKMEWDSSCNTGIMEIDAQHLELFNTAQKLIENVSGHLSEIEELFAFLEKYSEEHFELEEQCMKEVGYPFYQRQVEQHQRFIKTVSMIKKELLSGSGSKTYRKFRVQVLVIDWVINHTMKEDTHFAKYLRFETDQFPKQLNYN